MIVCALSRYRIMIRVLYTCIILIFYGCIHFIIITNCVRLTQNIKYVKQSAVADGVFT